MKWSEYVRKLTGSDKQQAVEKRTGIRQSTVSRWLAGEVMPSPAQAAKFAQAYGGNVLEAFVAAGFLTEQEAGMPPRPRLSFSELIDADPDLSPEAKVHIKNQYGLLKAASAQNRAILLREQIMRSQTLDAETREQLLATLDGGDDPRVARVAEAMGHEEARRYPHLVEEAARRDLREKGDGEPDPNVDEPGPEGGS